ncbi:uncharacterized protein LOC119996055 [Tripterygium wilfordii]|uniref:uncharacterized protein LOC119996055 n=1 Tax=Tripterygium wilfordii TaxID=458696 RepID=UPI0018F7E501|nr:uncharacterized protein LOC119996055 [Tripterygium wilfordii]
MSESPLQEIVEEDNVSQTSDDNDVDFDIVDVPVEDDGVDEVEAQAYIDVGVEADPSLNEYINDQNRDEELYDPIFDSVRGLSDDELDEDELRSIPSEVDSDVNDLDGGNHFPAYIPLKDMGNFNWEIGMVFNSRQQFVEAVSTYAVYCGRRMKWDKLDHTRARVICYSSCKFMLYASKITNEETWQLKSANIVHSCTRSQKVRMLNSSWLVIKLVPMLRRNPKLKLREIIMKVQDKYVASISLGLAARAKKKAMDVVQGGHKLQFKRLHDFCGEVLRSNPGSSCSVSAISNLYDAPSRTLMPVFENIYICLEACKKSFASCRPIIGIDGCFLKGVYGGQLLTAVGRDPNDQMLPIAFAVVDKETRATWRWFLGRLLEDIGSHRENRWTFVSDQQKGLGLVLDEDLQGVDHRFCVRHMYQNFKKVFPGLQLKELMWRAARATYPQEWLRVMREIEQVNNSAFARLMGTEPRFWTRSHFNGHPKCDTLVNNMSETFNSVILAAREMPIASMLEAIINYLMSRWADNREKIQSFKGIVLPRIQKRLDRNWNDSGRWIARWAGRGKFGVTNMQDTFTVDLDEKECSCRLWDLTGIPCSHAISCINFKEESVESYVPSCFKKDAYELCYWPLILPMNGPKLWENTGMPDILPPPICKKRGRPKKKRRLGEVALQTYHLLLQLRLKKWGQTTI